MQNYHCEWAPIYLIIIIFVSLSLTLSLTHSLTPTLYFCVHILTREVHLWDRKGQPYADLYADRYCSPWSASACRIYNHGSSHWNESRFGWKKQQEECVRAEGGAAYELHLLPPPPTTTKKQTHRRTLNFHISISISPIWWAILSSYILLHMFFYSRYLLVAFCDFIFPQYNGIFLRLLWEWSCGWLFVGDIGRRVDETKQNIGGGGGGEGDHGSEIQVEYRMCDFDKWKKNDRSIVHQKK